MRKKANTGSEQTPDNSGNSRFIYDEETLDMFDKRVDDFEKSGHKGLTVEESMEYLRKELNRHKQIK